MSFVAPALLGGIALIALPIALHLIMRRRPQHLTFPAMRFLQQRAESNRRQLRLRHLLLLFLRCAVIALLAFALARPSLRGSGALGGRQAPVAAVMVVDTSPRMQYEHGNQTRLDAARGLANRLVAQLPADSEVAVLSSRSRSGSFAVNRSAARQQIERLQTSPIARPLVEVVDRGLDLVQENPQQGKEIYVFTDLSESAWKTDGAEQLRERLADHEDVAVYLIDVGVEAPRNVGLGDLHLSGEQLTEGRPVQITTELIATMPEGQRNVELWLDDGEGTREKRGQQTVEWRDAEQTSITMTLGSLGVGTHQGYLRIVGEDGLKADDMRFFTIDVREPPSVLIAAGPETETVFVREALNVAGLRCETIAADAVTAQSLDDFDVVFLLDPPRLAESTWRSLAEFVEDGGGLAICLGRNATREAMNSEAAQRLLPGPLLRHGHDARHLSPATLQHPLLAPFRPFTGQIPWSQFPVLTYWQFESLQGDARTVVAFANRQPAIVERSLGEGRVLTLTTPLSDPVNERGRQPWNVLPAGESPWPFVVLAGAVADYLAGGDRDRLNYEAGETAVLQIVPEQSGSMFLLVTPRGDALRQSIDPRRRSIVVAADELGNYRIRAGGAVGGVRRGFSVNVPAAMTGLQRVSGVELDTLLGQGRYRIARSQEQLEERVTTGRVGVKLYPYIIVLLAVAMLLEHVLSNRFYRSFSDN